MQSTHVLSAIGLVLVLGTANANAQEASGSFQATGPRPAPASSSSGHGFGIGAESTLTGVTGAALVYDAGNWRIDGLLAFSSQGGTDLALAGRFWYVLHTGESSDLSIGGGLGLVDGDGGPMNDNDLDVHIEAGAQIRAFITSNVALSAAGGFGFVIDDGDDFLGFGGQLIGSMGVTYFFE